MSLATRHTSRQSTDKKAVTVFNVFRRKHAMRHATAAVVKRHEHSFSATGAVLAVGFRPSALLRSRRGAYCFGAGV